ncbi:WXG100 family type VII secretion target [Sutcliffiella cohnii]
MSYFIEVKYTEFEVAATAIDTYVSRQKQKMSLATQEVHSLSSGWKGKDFEQYRTKWQTLEDRDSTTYTLQKSLEDYAKTLRHVGDLYKNAQKKAIERANRL